MKWILFFGSQLSYTMNRQKVLTDNIPPRFLSFYVMMMSSLAKNLNDFKTVSGNSNHSFDEWYKNEYHNSNE